VRLEPTHSVGNIGPGVHYEYILIQNTSISNTSKMHVRALRTITSMPHSKSNPSCQRYIM
jgi:hypothetical protein